MTTFTVWKYDDPDRAAEAEGILRDAADEGVITVLDTAVVSWPVGAPQPTTRHHHQGTAHGARWGALWGFLFGAVFLVPVLGAAAGAALGAGAKAMTDVGIREDDIERIRAAITEGTSALFAVTDGRDLAHLGDRVHGEGGALVSTELTDAENDSLRGLAY